MAPKVVGTPDHPASTAGASPLGSCVDGADRGDGRRDRTDPDALEAPITDASADEPTHTVPWWGPLTIVAFVALVVCTNVANAVFAAWVDDHPAGLLALSSASATWRWRRVDGIGVVPYVVIGTLRIAAAFVVCHLAGRAYRDSILRIFTRYLGLTPEAHRRLPPRPRRAEIVIIPFFVGSNIVAALTGVRAHPPGQAGGAAGDRHRRSPGPGVVAGQGVRGADARRRQLPPALPAVGDHHLHRCWCCSSTCATSAADAADGRRDGGARRTSPSSLAHCAMAEITLRGNPVHTVGELPEVGSAAPGVTAHRHRPRAGDRRRLAAAIGDRAEHLPVDRHAHVRRQRPHLQPAGRRAAKA